MKNLDWGKEFMRNKKLLSIFLVAVLAVGSLAACGKQEKETNKTVTATTAPDSTDNKETPATDAPKEVKTLTFYSADGVEDPWTDPVALKITELSGYKLDIDFPINGDDQRIALMIAAEEYPDLIFAKGGTPDLIDAGALLDLTDLIEEHGQNIKKLFGENFYRLKRSEEDPGIYTLGIGGVGATKYTTDGSMQLQYDVLAKAGYPVVKTLEQYEQLLTDYKAANPTIVGPDGGTYETIGMSLSTADWHWYITLSNPSGFVSGSPDNGQWIIDEDTYEAVYKHAAPGQYEYYKWLNHMFDIGLLDSEFATQTHDDYLAKIATGRVLGIADASWDYNSAVASLLNAGMYERGYAALPVGLTEDTKVALLQDQGYSGGWGVGITTACEDPVAAIKFLDWLCTDEAQVLIHWGIEGVNYKLDENGKRYLPKEEYDYSKNDSDYSKKTGVGFHSYPFPQQGDGRVDANGETYTPVTEESKIENYNAAEKAAVDAWGVTMLKDIFPQTDEFEISDFGAAWQSPIPSDTTLSTFLTEADNISWEYLVKSVVCKPADFDKTWNEFQDRLKAIGMEQANKDMTELIKAKVEFWSNN